MNHQQGGELSARLSELYGYMASRLLQGHLEQSSEPFDEVEKLMLTLLESWENVDTARILRTVCRSGVWDILPKRTRRLTSAVEVRAADKPCRERPITAYGSESLASPCITIDVSPRPPWAASVWASCSSAIPIAAEAASSSPPAHPTSAGFADRLQHLTDQQRLELARRFFQIFSDSRAVR